MREAEEISKDVRHAQINNAVHRKSGGVRGYVYDRDASHLSIMFDDKSCGIVKIA